MKYVALLRGVNVGGANMVSMAELKAAFQAAGVHDVRTYINSGNIIFSSDAVARGQLTDRLQKAIRAHGGPDVNLQLRDVDELAAVVDSIPSTWTNDATMKCDVVFLQDDVDRREILDEFGPRPGVEDAFYVPGAVIWRVYRKDATRSRLTRIAGSALYRRVTVRNCNTVRKIVELMRD